MRGAGSTGMNILVETGLMLSLCARDVSGVVLVAQNWSDQYEKLSSCTTVAVLILMP